MASELRVNTLKDASGNNSVAVSTVFNGSAKAWFNYDQVANSVRDSVNTSSFSDDSTGDFKANLASAMSDANYTTVGSNHDSTTPGVNGIMWLVGNDDSGSDPGTFTSSQCRFGAYYYAANRIDATRNKVNIHGDLA
jgi:hypothetical protein